MVNKDEYILNNMCQNFGKKIKGVLRDREVKWKSE